LEFAAKFDRQRYVVKGLRLCNAESLICAQEFLKKINLVENFSNNTCFDQLQMLQSINTKSDLDHMVEIKEI